MVKFIPTGPQNGTLPDLFDEGDPRGALEQAKAKSHSGTVWPALENFSLGTGPQDRWFYLRAAVTVECEQDMFEISRASFRNQWIVLFDRDLIAVFDKDDMSRFEVARVR